MKKLLILLFLVTSLLSFSQNSVKSKAIINKIVDNGFNQNYLERYCVHFYYNDILYTLSYDSENNVNTLTQRAIYLFKHINNEWQYASDFIFISNISYNFNIDFLDYPYPISGNSIVKILDNKCVFVSMSYRECIFNRQYRYPIILLLIPNLNNTNMFFNTVLFSPNRINNRYGIKINDNGNIIMNDKSNIQIKFNKLDFVNSKYNITFVDEKGDFLNYEK